MKMFSDPTPDPGLPSLVGREKGLPNVARVDKDQLTPVKRESGIGSNQGRKRYLVEKKVIIEKSKRNSSDTRYVNLAST